LRNFVFEFFLEILFFFLKLELYYHLHIMLTTLVYTTASLFGLCLVILFFVTEVMRKYTSAITLAVNVCFLSASLYVSKRGAY